jgi:hypothetical protein
MPLNVFHRERSEIVVLSVIVILSEERSEESKHRNPLRRDCVSQ